MLAGAAVAGFVGIIALQAFQTPEFLISDSATLGAKAQASEFAHTVSENGNEDTSGMPASEASSSHRAIVHVDGAVIHEGIFELDADNARVGDAVQAAGGLSAQADTSQLNLAAHIQDGQKIHVPKVGEIQAEAQLAQNSTEHSVAQRDSSSPALQASSGLININTASQEELETLPGVGERTAEAIIASRQNEGSFSSIEDIKRVDGIGEKKFNKLKAKICVA